MEEPRSGYAASGAASGPYPTSMPAARGAAGGGSSSSANPLQDPAARALARAAAQQLLASERSSSSARSRAAAGKEASESDLLCSEFVALIRERTKEAYEEALRLSDRILELEPGNRMVAELPCRKGG